MLTSFYNDIHNQLDDIIMKSSHAFDSAGTGDSNDMWLLGTLVNWFASIQIYITMGHNSLHSLWEFTSEGVNSCINTVSSM